VVNHLAFLDLRGARCAMRKTRCRLFSAVCDEFNRIDSIYPLSKIGIKQPFTFAMPIFRLSETLSA
jgi:hypothetical protein